MTEFPKIIMILGAVLLIIGAVLHFVGKMPGDIFVKKRKCHVFLPGCHLYYYKCGIINFAQSFWQNEITKD